MRPANQITLFVTAYLAAFFAGLADGLRGWIGVQVDLLPCLMVYCALTAGLGLTTGLAITAGLLVDSLSQNPLGISVPGLFAVGLLIHQQRELILRDQVYAQTVLGIGACLLAPAVTIVFLLGSGHAPLVGWGTVWQLGVMTVAGGCLTPVCFWFFDRINAAFNYQPMPESSFRSDRETKRGRT